MAKIRRFRLASALAFATAIAATSLMAGAQAPCSGALSAPAGSRLAGDWQSSPAAALPSANSPVLRAGIDLGVAPGNTRLDRMLLLLEPSSAQQKALDALLRAQQTRTDCAYHQWLTPAQFADSFANSASDVDAIAAWLTRQGFTVAPLPAGRGWIEFSGTAAQVEQAFGAPVHSFASASGTRFALEGRVSVPAVFVPLIRGLVSLDGALSAPALTTPQVISTAPSVLAAETSAAQAEALTPRLLAPLLQLDALHAGGTTGAGETVAIAARSNVQAADIAAFRSTFGLPTSAAEVSLNGSDPGLTGDQAEAELAASWAGAAAPGAHILLVPAATTAATDGADLSIASIIDHNLAHTVVVDFSACEASLSEAHQAFYAAVYRQAAAQGMTAIAASGDSGAAACHTAGSDAPVNSGYAVNGLASTPWNTAVGAAAFAATGGSALAGWSPVGTGDPAYAGGGGRSTVFGVPSWQAFLQPQNTGRMLPDIALPTGVDSALSRGVAFCFSGTATPSGCTLMRSGGTSAAAAIFGGIAALAAQQDGPQGNLAPALYGLSTRDGVFTDVQVGTAALACAAGSPDCDASGKIGYAAGNGYDLATGLGSPNAQSLLAALAQPDGSGADTVSLAVAPSQGSYNPSASITLTATVASGTGGATPTGTVNFVNQNTNQNLNSSPITLSNGQASITVSGVFASGSTNIIAAYSGNTTYAAKNSAPQTVTVQASTTTTAVTPSTYSPIPGTPFNVTVTVTVGNPPAGTANPGGNIQLKLDGGNTLTQAATTTGGVTSATFSETVSTSGAHNLQAVYVGDANYQTSTSQSVSINAANNTPTVTLSVSPVLSAYNPSAQLTFTAVVASQDGGNTPTGNVTFLDQTTGHNLGSGAVTLNNGSASVTMNGGLPVNGNNIIANYNGDSNYTKASSSVLSVNIQASSTTTTVTPSTYNPTPDTAFSVTATVAVGTPPAGASNPTGTMTLKLDGGSPQTAQVSTAGGVTSATFSVTLPSSGQHNLQAVYAGDSNYATSTSQSVSVNAATETASVNLSVSPVQSGGVYNPSATLVFTAAVSSQTGGPTPTGTVAFLDQATGQDLGGGAVTLKNGTATVTVNGGLPVNGNSIIAQYTPASGSPYSSANSQALTVNIQPSSTTATVTPSTTTPTAGTPFTVTVAITVGTPPAGTANPTGKVTLTLDGTTSQTATLSTTGGVTSAKFTQTVPSGGSHNLQAVYAGDANFAGSTSSSVAVNASKGATVTTLTADPTTLTPGTPESFTATIAATATTKGASDTFTGSVTFFDGSSQLGTATVSGNSATLSNITLSGTTTTHVITAMYSGDDNWAGSTSNAVTLKAVLFPVTVTLTATPATAGPGQVVTLTATVTPTTAPASTAEQNPTGNVVFYNGTTVLGTVALTPAQGNTSTAQLLFSTLPAGQDSLTAVYVGDLFYATGTSNAITVTVQDFTITPSPSNPPEDLDIIKGSAGSLTYTIAGLGGFNNTISVVCSVPPQDDMTCAASPLQVTPGQSVTFTVTTFASGGPTARNSAPPLWPPAAGGVAFAVLVIFLLPAGKRVRIFNERGRRMLLLALLLAGLTGAGIGCSSVSGVNSNGGTPLGETTLTITAASNIDNTVVSHSVYFNVNVLPVGSTGTSQPVKGGAK